MGILNRSYEHISKGHQRLDVGDFRDRVTLIKLENVPYDAMNFGMKPSHETYYNVYGAFVPYGGGFVQYDGQNIDNSGTSKVYLRQFPKDIDNSWRVLIYGKRYRITRIYNIDSRSKYVCVMLAQLGDNDKQVSKM